MTCVEFGDVASFLPDEVLRYGQKFATIKLFMCNLKNCFLTGMQSPQNTKLFWKNRVCGNTSCLPLYGSKDPGFVGRKYSTIRSKLLKHKQIFTKKEKKNMIVIKKKMKHCYCGAWGEIWKSGEKEDKESSRSYEAVVLTKKRNLLTN